MEPKTTKRNGTDSKAKKRTTRIKAKQSNKNETLFSIFSVDIPFRFSRYGNGVKGEKQKLFENFHKNSLQKEKCVVLCRRKGIPTAISRAY
jgi:hypothetical protein